MVARDDLPSVPDAGFTVQPLDRIAPPTPAEFLARYVRPRRPVIVTGLTEGWLPREQWSVEALGTRHGDAQVIAAVLANGTLKDEPGTGVRFERIELRRFVASLLAGEGAGHYVMAPAWNFGPSLEPEYRVPAYCRDAPRLRVKVWLGQRGTVTPMHRDVPHNLNVHLTGHKRWLLFPPSASRQLYPRGLFSGMPNFAHVDPEHPDYARYPRFRGATALGGTVGPGETLFIPHGWWHHTRSLDDATAINFWWATGLIYMASLASDAFKRLRRIRSDEWG